MQPTEEHPVRHSLLVIHIAGGALGLLAGFVALYARKGGTVHRRVGVVFVFAMLTMTLGALAYMAAGRTGPPVNVVAASLTTYLVVTSIAAVRPFAWWTRRTDFLALFAVGAVTAGAAWLSGLALTSEKRTLDGIPPFPYLMFATIGALCVIGDVRRIVATAPLTRTSQLVRHLWRMSFALFIAAMSFFLGQADEIPLALRIPALLALPPLAVLLTMFYWLWRVRMRRVLLVRSAADAPSTALSQSVVAQPR